MENNTKRYFDEYIKFLYRTKVTDHKGRVISFSSGVRRTITLLKKSISRGGKIMFIGNGGSASIASHFALDYWHSAGMRSISFNDGAQLTCLSNDHGYEEVFSMPIQMMANPNDVLVAISSSGQSVNILNGVAAARGKKCYVITLSGFAANNNLRKLGDFNFHIPAHQYGYVELAHTAILHCILDLSQEKK